MRATRTITASLAAVLGAAAIAGPAAADSHTQPDSWYAGKSTIEGSKHSGQQGANDSAKANVYVPPADTSSDTLARANDSAKANVYVPPADTSSDTLARANDSAKANVYVPPADTSSDTLARANDSAKANVYVPPADTSSDTLARANDSAKANVYVPPNPQPIQRHVPAASASSWDFDWGSAGIGIAGAIGAFLIALGGAAGLRRRRQIQSVTG